MSIEAPEGTVFMEPATHHAGHYIRLAVADAEHNVQFLKVANDYPWWLHRMGVNLVGKRNISSIFQMRILLHNVWTKSRGVLPGIS